jgi:hypothetical protein
MSMPRCVAHESRSATLRHALAVVALPCCIALSCTVAGYPVPILTSTPPPPTLEPEYTDRSWLADDPCAAPCWHGLIPSSSTRAEAIEVLGSLPFLNVESVHETAIHAFDWSTHPALLAEGSLVTVECRRPARSSCVSMIFVGDLLMEVAILPNFPITFSAIVNQLGPPDYVRRAPDTLYHCYLSLIWATRQIEAIHRGDADLCGSLADAGYQPPGDLDAFEVWLAPAQKFEDMPREDMDIPFNGFFGPQRAP